MPRNLAVVIGEIQKLLPMEFELQTELMATLNSIKISSRYTAPELMHERWNQTARALNHYLGTEQLPWQKKIAQIFSGEINVT